MHIKGKVLDIPTAVDLIIETFQGKQHLQTADINDRIAQRHRDRGGLPAEDSFATVAFALDALKSLQFAYTTSEGWNILSIDKMMNRFEHFRTIAHRRKKRK